MTVDRPEPSDAPGVPFGTPDAGVNEEAAGLGRPPAKIRALQERKAGLQALKADVEALNAAVAKVMPEHRKMAAATVDALAMLLDAALSVTEASLDLRRRARGIGAPVPPSAPRPDLLVLTVATAALKAHEGRLSPGGKATLALLEERIQDL